MTVTLSLCANHPAPAEVPSHRHGRNLTVTLTGPSLAYVRVEPAVSASTAQSRSLAARVAFDDRHIATIGPPVQGRVASVNVVTGDHVERGAVLLTIHAPEIATANAQVLEAHEALLLGQRTAERARTLALQNAGSIAEQQQTEAAVVQARIEEQRASATRAALGGAHGSSDYELHSPISGTVVERAVAVGAEVHADQDLPLLTVADLSTIWVIADVFEQDLPLIHVNDEAIVHVAAYPARVFTGRVSYVGDTIDQVTRVAHARVVIENTDGALRPGMFAHVDVRGRIEGSAEVPVSALLARRDQFFMFVRNPDGTFIEREVRPGEQHGARIIVLSGIRPGDSVVTQGAILLDSEANDAL